MKKFTITFAGGKSFTTMAADRDDAQDKAIDHFEAHGIAHEAIVSIRRVEVSA